MIKNSRSQQSDLLKQMTIPIFIPHLGCGHSCTFCNQRTISGVEKEHIWSSSQIKEHIDTWLVHASQFNRIEIGFFGGSFTGISEQLQEQYLEIAQEYLDQGKIDGIRLSTRPDYLGAKVIDRLKAYKVSMVEIGVQSYSDEVLLAAKRGHDSKCVEEAIARLKEAKIEFGIQLMIGLPGDTHESWRQTIMKVISDQPSCVRIYPTLVLAGTELANQYESGCYEAISLETAVQYGAEAYLAFNEANISVIRMGLQASDGLSSEGNVIAGPHHDAFRSLVETEIYKNIIKRDLESRLDANRYNVRVNPKHVSFFSGYKRSNLIWLETQGIHISKIISDVNVFPYQIIWLKER